MPDIVIVGNLNELSVKLRHIKEVIANRVATGYSSRLHEFEFRFATVQDDNVCPTCVPLNGDLWRADYISSEFPYSVSINDEVIMAHNETNYHSAQICRCTLTMTNKHEAVVYLFFRELENA